MNRNFDALAYAAGAAGLLALLVALALVNGCAIRKNTVNGIPNFKQVAPGVWRGGQPDAEGWRTLLGLGVTNVVKLNTGAEGSDIPALGCGMAVREYPISFLEQTVGEPSRLSLAIAVELIEPGTFVHCLHGQDRTGLVVALWRVRKCGWTKQEARAEMLACGFHKSLKGLERAWEDEPETEHAEHGGLVNISTGGRTAMTTKFCGCGKTIFSTVPKQKLAAEAAPTKEQK